MWAERVGDAHLVPHCLADELDQRGGLRLPAEVAEAAAVGADVRRAAHVRWLVRLIGEDLEVQDVVEELGGHCGLPTVAASRARTHHLLRLFMGTSPLSSCQG